MTAFALIFSRKAAETRRSGVEPEYEPTQELARALGGMLGTLAHRGGDGCALRGSSAFALGAHVFWTTPEEQGELQPIESEDRRFVLAFDGRIDNRDDLIARIGADPRASDASLALASFRRLGTSGISAIEGPLAVVIVDRLENRVLAACDAQARRAIFYTSSRECLLLASEEASLLSHPSVSRSIDHARISSYLALRPTKPGRTFFRELRELPPGHILLADQETHLERRLFSMTSPRIAERDLETSAQLLRERLESAVSKRLRAAGPVAISLSGGLDSSAIAALAAPLSRGGPPLFAVSAIFDELGSCDSRDHTQRVADALDVPLVTVLADDCWPLSGFGTWPTDPSTPVQNAFRRFQDRIWSVARAEGARVVLLGASADGLYAGLERWLRDRFERGGAISFVQGLFELSKHRGIRGLSSAPMRRLFFPRGLRTHEKPPPWLSQHARWALDERFRSPENEAAERPEAHGIAFAESMWVHDSAGLPAAARQGVELRDPFRDRRVVELMLSLPPRHLFSFAEGPKLVQRRALEGYLPRAVLSAPRHGTLEPLFRRLWDEEGPRVRDLLLDSRLHSFMDPDWLRLAAKGPPPSELQQVVAWQCVSLSLWLRRYGYDL
ncbi:MAG: asparagine synthetase B [Deltaproteobacteria bacterium]|nr:asparagine synthetase B [Deltaproteobacteria bacterium]